jgi:predicted RNA-binding Zn-ribbon protein involved in translation (DUF1610 family)
MKAGVYPLCRGCMLQLLPEDWEPDRDFYKCPVCGSEIAGCEACVWAGRLRGLFLYGLWLSKKGLRRDLLALLSIVAPPEGAFYSMRTLRGATWTVVRRPSRRLLAWLR